MTSIVKQRAAHEPLYDINPQTGATIEVFYADRALEKVLAGSGGLAGEAIHQRDRRRVRLPQGTRRIVTQ